MKFSIIFAMILSMALTSQVNADFFDTLGDVVDQERVRAWQAAPEQVPVQPIHAEPQLFGD